ncbi:unnamed protein product [Clonostachys chloroleuca]|uniref:Uncharacterized protein n=1 Tax=Clonostachys chloroleuca TaxID=1926264 RepID=A0AA35M6P3_9HYPO|nr:unnamed protein product [Clonostachys chloroleuca]
MSPKWYPVYKVKYNIALPDPDMPPGRLHHAVFVEKHSDGSGYLYHVTDQWDSVLRSLPTPPQQKASNPSKQGRVEPFKEKIGRHEFVFYEPGEERQPLWKCTEWVEDYAIPALHQNGLIQAQGESSLTQDSSSTAEVEWVWDEHAQLYRYWDETVSEWKWQGSE